MHNDERILVVDDSTLNQKLLRDILHRDYTVEIANSGEECLEKFREFEPDLVLLDILMPGMNGYEVCQVIKDSPVGEFTQVILVSGNSTTEARLSGYEVLADDYITKPFNPYELKSKVKVQFRLRRAQAKLFEMNSKLEDYSERLEEMVASRTAEIVEVQDLALFALAQLADSRDPETGEHLVRMRNYSQVLAEQLSKHGPYVEEIDTQFLRDLYRASPLHDIGKVGIPDHVLLKPGRLTPEEFRTMQQHVNIGADALENGMHSTSHGEFLKMAVDVARYHHERFDGTGYCSGLSGYDIPLAARIVSVADVYDALTSARIYKPAFEATKAEEIIVEGAGSQFDPAIVDAFLACRDTIQTQTPPPPQPDIDGWKELSRLLGG